MDKPKAICPLSFFKVGGIKSVLNLRKFTIGIRIVLLMSGNHVCKINLFQSRIDHENANFKKES